MAWYTLELLIKCLAVSLKAYVVWIMTYVAVANAMHRLEGRKKAKQLPGVFDIAPQMVTRYVEPGMGYKCCSR